MSRHHRKQNWTTHSPRLRKLIEPRLPLPCVNCGQPVRREDKWQVGHRLDAMAGGRPTISNVGPVHCKSPIWPRNCNQVAGGKLGAAITNAGRRAAAREPDIRPW